MTKYCPNCGVELIDDANFCKSCGASMNTGVPRAEVPQPPVYEKSYTVLIVVGYILALLIWILGIGMSIYLLTRKDSEKARRHGKYVLILSIVMMIYSIISVLFIY